MTSDSEVTRDRTAAQKTAINPRINTAVRVAEPRSRLGPGDGVLSASEVRLFISFSFVSRRWRRLKLFIFQIARAIGGRNRLAERPLGARVDIRAAHGQGDAHLPDVLHLIGGRLIEDRAVLHNVLAL